MASAALGRSVGLKHKGYNGNDYLLFNKSYIHNNMTITMSNHNADRGHVTNL